MVRLRPLLLWLMALLIMAATGCSSCNRSDDGTAPTSTELTPLELRDDTPGLLLTWIDNKGDFHVVTRPQDVPDNARDAVRVVSEDRQEGTGEQFYVADLRSKGPAGAYPVRTMSRSEWELLAQKRRDTTMAQAAPPPAQSATGEKLPKQVQPSAALSVVVYGAQWCAACHDATKYLRRRGVAVVEKDIEQDPKALQEMQAKLCRAGLPVTGSIPVLDVRGRMLLGFNQRELDRAIAQVTTGDTL